MRTKLRRHDRQRGASLVEAAIVLPIILMIVLAVFELGMMFKSSTVAGTASRSGARLASSVYAPAPDRTVAANLVAGAVAESLRDRTPGDTPQQLRIFRAQADGTPVGGNYTTCATDCLRYSWSGTAWTLSGGSWTAPDACGVTIDSIGVWVSVRHTSINSLIPFNRTMEANTVMRLEPRPGSQCTGSGGES